MDAQTGEYIVTASTRLKQKDGVDRVAAIDVSLDGIAEDVSRMSDDRLKVALVNGTSFEILAHVKTERVSHIISESSDNELEAEITKFIKNSKEGMEKGTVYATSSATITASKDSGHLEVAGVIDLDRDRYFVLVTSIKGTDWIVVSYSYS